MAGHSQFKNIMHRKGRQDSLRARLFSKLSREITVAAKNGLRDPSMNPRLRLAVQNAKAVSMPKENIQRAISKADSIDSAYYEEVRYEGYGPDGVSVIVEALTDNRNRTASNIRSAFTKAGGELGETGSVSFLWDRCGEIVYNLEAGSSDKVMEAAIHAGADDFVLEEDACSVFCDFRTVSDVAKALEDSLGVAESVKIIWKPRNNIFVSAEHVESLMKLISVLDDDDDVQNVYANFEVDNETIEKFSRI